MVNFHTMEAGLTQKWGKISPAVQWCWFGNILFYSILEPDELHRTTMSGIA